MLSATDIKVRILPSHFFRWGVSTLLQKVKGAGRAAGRRGQCAVGCVQAMGLFAARSSFSAGAREVVSAAALCHISGMASAMLPAAPGTLSYTRIPRRQPRTQEPMNAYRPVGFSLPNQPGKPEVAKNKEQACSSSCAVEAPVPAGPQPERARQGQAPAGKHHADHSGRAALWLGGTKRWVLQLWLVDAVFCADACPPCGFE